MWILAITQVLQALFAWKHPRFWIPIDVKEFVANGSADSLLRTFHRKRGLIRGTAIVLTSIAAAIPVGLKWPLPVMFLGNVSLQGGYWYWYFNPNLNLARKLPYIGEYHVSWNPDAAWIDRVIWRWACLKWLMPNESWYKLLWNALLQKGMIPPAHEDLTIVNIAGPLYKKVLRYLLFIGISIYSVALIIVVTQRF